MLALVVVVVGLVVAQNRVAEAKTGNGTVRWPAFMMVHGHVFVVVIVETVGRPVIEPCRTQRVILGSVTTRTAFLGGSVPGENTDERHLTGKPAVQLVHHHVTVLRNEHLAVALAIRGGGKSGHISSFQTERLDAVVEVTEIGIAGTGSVVIVLLATEVEVGEDCQRLVLAVAMGIDNGAVVVNRYANIDVVLGGLTVHIDVGQVVLDDFRRTQHLEDDCCVLVLQIYAACCGEWGVTRHMVIYGLADAHGLGHLSNADHFVDSPCLKG